MPEQRKAGRPQGSDNYQPEFCDKVIELGREGASKAEIALAIGISRQTLDNWCESHPDLLDAVKEATSLAQGWWESQGRKATFGASPGFNATAYIFNMKNRFPGDWRDKVEAEVTLKPHEDCLEQLE